MRKPVTVLGLVAASALLAVTGTGPAAAARALVGHESLTWSELHSPDGAGNSVLDALSCVSPDTCTATGHYMDGTGVLRTLAESWDGTRWSVQPSPSPGTYSNYLSAVSCVSAHACMAVGYDDSSSPGRTLTESWDGTHWSVVPSPNPVGDDALYGVSCVATDACTAVGAASVPGNSNVVSTLVESWDGTHWSVVPSPNPSAGVNTLSSVSCTAEDACTAVGSSASSSNGPTTTLVESWDGTHWSAVPSPSPGTRVNNLASVSCASEHACTAAGSAASASSEGALVESWDGRRWSVQPSPHPGHGFILIQGVSCASKDTCVAAGYYNGSRVLIESWDGRRWSVALAPHPGQDNWLTGVSCASRDACMVAGDFYKLGVYHTLTEAGTASGPSTERGSGPGTPPSHG